MLSSWSFTGDQDNISVQELESQFQAVRRLVASKAGFIAFTQLPRFVSQISHDKNSLINFRFREKLGMKVVKALKREHDGVSHAAIDMLATLLCVRNCFIYVNSS